MSEHTQDASELRDRPATSPEAFTHERRPNAAIDRGAANSGTAGGEALDASSGLTVRPSRRWAWFVVVLALCLGAAGAWFVAGRSQSPEQAAARAEEPPASWVTAEVDLRVLSATVIQRGDVGAEVSVSVEAPGSVEQPAVVTKPPPASGDAVTDGDVVVEVSGRPVFVFEGSAAMYRSLRPGMTGPDVAQLQDALSRLGYAPDSDGVFGESTKVALDAWYSDAGYSVVPAFDTAEAEITAARQSVVDANVAVEAANAALAAAQEGPSVLEVTQAEMSVDQAERALASAQAQRVAEVRLAEEGYNATIRERDRLAQRPEATPSELEAAELQIDQAGAQLEATRRSTADAVTAAQEALLVATIARDELVAPADISELQRAVDAAVNARSQAETALAAVVARNGPTVPLGEALFLPRLPARIRPQPSQAQDPGGAENAGSLVELSGGDLIVTTSVRVGDAGLIRAGMSAVLLDETTATEYSATVESIADDPVTGVDGQSGYPAVIVPDEPLPDQLVGSNLRVTITSASTDTETLVVPLAAVSSAADGTTRVSVVDSVNDAEPVDVQIEAGLSADGFVAITPTRPGQLTEGDLVVIGQ